MTGSAVGGSRPLQGAVVHATGVADVDGLVRWLARVTAHDVPPAGWVAATPVDPRALGSVVDWGSGTGRLSFALAAHADRVTGVDVSESMLAVLRDRAAERGVRNVTPTLVPDFPRDGGHDLAVSLLVLQHLPSRDAIGEALGAMVAGVRPGGVVAVEIPDRALLWRARVQPRRLAYRLLTEGLHVSPQAAHRRGLSGISMRTVPPEWVAGRLAVAGARVIARDVRVEPDFRYVRYAAVVR